MTTTSKQLAARSKAIHAKCRQLGMDEDTRRTMLHKLEGVTSTKDLNLSACERVLQHLVRAGAINPRAGRRTITPAADRKPLIDKIYRLLGELSELAGERYTIRYADAIAKKNGWGETVELCSPERLKDVVAALNRTLQFKLHG